jgi:hypothetical protein
MRAIVRTPHKSVPNAHSAAGRAARPPSVRPATRAHARDPIG